MMGLLKSSGSQSRPLRPRPAPNSGDPRREETENRNKAAEETQQQMTGTIPLNKNSPRNILSGSSVLRCIL